MLIAVNFWSFNLDYFAGMLVREFIILLLIIFIAAFLFELKLLLLLFNNLLDVDDWESFKLKLTPYILLF